MTKSLKEEVKKSKDISLIYVNIPFCKYKCHFCCFCREFGSDLLSIKKLKASYIKALKMELAVKSAYFTRKHKVNLKAINFGGGTPSLLTVEELHEILSSILEFFNQKISRVIDVSIEVTPDSLTPAKLRGLKSIGFNRISIGVQTFNQQVLNRLNRRHSIKQVYNSYDWARSAGFEKVNIDLLYPLPFQTFDDFKKDLEITVNLNPEHISPSPLLAVKSPLLSANLKQFKKTTPKRIQWSKYAYQFLEDNGYSNYFHKYFSKKGKESVTELIYYYAVPYIGIGAGANSIIGYNTSNIKSYIANPVSSRTLFEKDAPLSLRKVIYKLLLFPEGIYIPYFNRRFDCDIEKLLKNPKFNNPVFNRELKEWQKQGILEKRSNYIGIAPEARFSKETWKLYMSTI